MGRVVWRARGVAVGALLLVAAGCLWPTPGQGADRRAHNERERVLDAGTVSGLERAWEAPVDEGPVGDPVTSSRGIHVNGRRSVYGFAATSGARLWEYGVVAPASLGQPWFLGGRLHVNAVVPTEPSGRLYGARFELDPATGAVLAGPTERRVGAVRGRRVMLYSDSPDFRFSFWHRSISVLDTATGATSPCCSGFQRSSSSVDRGEAPFTLTETAILHAGVGALVDLPPEDPRAGGNGVRSYATAVDSRCQHLQVVCPTWATPLDGTTATVPVLGSEATTAYVGTDAGTLYAVDPATGAVRWSASVGSAITDAPALAHGSLFVPTAAGDLVALAVDGCGAATCEPLWTAPAGSPITQQPAVAGGVVFTGSADGSLHAFDAQGCANPTCTHLWSASTGSEITGAPAVSHGRVFAGTGDGRLVAYALPAP